MAMFKVIARVKDYHGHLGRPGQVGGSLPRGSIVMQARTLHVQSNVGVAKAQLDVLHKDRVRLQKSKPSPMRDAELAEVNRKIAVLQRMMAQETKVMQLRSVHGWM